MDTSVFIDNKLNQITTILAKEKNKNVYIAGDFNFDLLKYSNHSETANFFDKMTSNLLVPLILIPTKINTIFNFNFICFSKSYIGTLYA